VCYSPSLSSDVQHLGEMGARVFLLALLLKEQSQPLIQAPNQRCTSIGLASCFLMLLGSKSSSMWRDSPTVMTIVVAKASALAHEQ
jgi:hypothetical protein